MVKKNKKQVLGRGLSALLDDPEREIDSPSNDNSDELVGKVIDLEIDKIVVNPYQPRTQFREEAIGELAESIKTLGIIQPVTVRKLGRNQYQIVSGERRYRASKSIGLKTIPSFVRVANDQETLEMALVENIQRKDLDPIEIAISYKRLIEELKISHDQMSKRVGKDRSTISNYMRLLKLDPIIQSGIRDEFISMGHGRALIGIGSHEIQLSVYEKILKNKLSVRQTEDLIKNLNGIKKDKKFKNIDSDVIKIIDEINKKFDYNLKISTKGGKAQISFNYKNKNDLISILKKLNG